MNDIGKSKKMRTANEKEGIVIRYLNGESPTKLAHEIGSTDKMIREWTNKYKEKGIDESIGTRIKNVYLCFQILKICYTYIS